MASFHLIGLMSGTSLDGVDLTYCNFSKNDDLWDFKLIYSKAVSYPEELHSNLSKSVELDVPELLQLDHDLAIFFAEEINKFIADYSIPRKAIDAVASHGHTVFHQPKRGFTLQIGCGETLAYETKLKVINDFRQKDVAAGGQGAPLVPIGDKLLFRDYSAFLNIGGFTNVSYQENDSVYAFDIGPGNLPLNKIVKKLGHDYDDRGSIAKSGEIIEELLEELNRLQYYSLKEPKSLGIEWLLEVVYPLIDSSKSEPDVLRTLVEHIATQISAVVKAKSISALYVTGGGAKNSYLIDRIRELSGCNVFTPSEELIDFKESIVFAFLGALFLNNEINILSSVTGASRDVIGGVLHSPK